MFTYTPSPVYALEQGKIPSYFDINKFGTGSAPYQIQNGATMGIVYSQRCKGMFGDVAGVMGERVTPL